MLVAHLHAARTEDAAKRANRLGARLRVLERGVGFLLRLHVVPGEGVRREIGAMQFLIDEWDFGGMA